LEIKACPIAGCRSRKDIPGRTLERWHLLNSAESAILPSGIPVPVNDNDRQTGNQKKSQGRSTEGAPVLIHGDDMIIPGDVARNVAGTDLPGATIHVFCNPIIRELRFWSPVSLP
jgi:hypothetical protein